MAARPGGAAPEERVLIFYEGEAADAGASTTAASVTLPHPRTGAAAGRPPPPLPSGLASPAACACRRAR